MSKFELILFFILIKFCTEWSIKIATSKYYFINNFDTKNLKK